MAAAARPRASAGRNKVRSIIGKSAQQISRTAKKRARSGANRAGFGEDQKGNARVVAGDPQCCRRIGLVFLTRPPRLEGPKEAQPSGVSGLEQRNSFQALKRRHRGRISHKWHWPRVRDGRPRFVIHKDSCRPFRAHILRPRYPRAHAAGLRFFRPFGPGNWQCSSEFARFEIGPDGSISGNTIKLE